MAFVAEAVAGLTGKAPLVTRSDLRSARDNYWLCDAGRIRAELGFRTEVEFARGSGISCASSKPYGRCEDNSQRQVKVGTLASPPRR